MSMPQISTDQLPYISCWCTCKRMMCFTASRSLSFPGRTGLPRLACLPAYDPVLALYLLKLLVSNGGNIYAENSMGYSPLSLIKDAALKADMVYQTRRSLLLFLEAVCVTDDHTNNKSFQRVAENSDLTNFILGFL